MNDQNWNKPGHLWLKSVWSGQKFENPRVKRMMKAARRGGFESKIVIIKVRLESLRR